MITYVILVISILILYLTIKSRMLVCPTDMKVVNSEQRPLRVSEIFRDMFQEREPIPGNIRLNIDGVSTPNY